MSTRAIIGVKKGNSYEYVYSHYDNYLDHVGAMLLKNYNSLDAVEKLISLGEISSMGAQLKNDCRNMDDWFELPEEERGVIAYFRDRKLTECTVKWDEVKPRVATDINQVYDHDYTYIFDADKGEWEVAIWKTYDNANGPIFYNLISLLETPELEKQFLEGK